jgi:hypothetical protein
MAEDPNEVWPLAHSSYGKWYKEQMNAFQEALWEHLEAIPTLEPQVRGAVMHYLLELACQAQNITNISLGRQALLALPRDWLLHNIERSAEFLLEVEDEWEYRRLLEVYQHLDKDLVRRLALRGLNSTERGIQEAAQERLE